MSKVDVKELACLYGLDGFIPANGDWLEFVDYMKQYTRHVLELAAKEIDDVDEACAAAIREMKPGQSWPTYPG